ncbi:hypothetical protein UFOVP257_389 [uncultured Caudovirales phage]|uniref:Uncharacterized protein n=1 Tax=uncultured Caudovirales phage TaxID=2100421 RepID=A0A6J5LKR9_9CAUD|nr:hypothetical protein UFOVP257_389 [uncultured Caudovirales phage]
MITREFILIALAIVAGIYIAVVTYPNNGQVINCSIAEISPDYSNAMKEACRKARSEK